MAQQNGEVSVSRGLDGRALVARWAASVPGWAWYVLGVYFATRLAFLAPAIGVSLVKHIHLGAEVSNWDGRWYLLMSQSGYPTTIPHLSGQYSTLGFLPLYPLLI